MPGIVIIRVPYLSNSAGLICSVKDSDSTNTIANSNSDWAYSLSTTADSSTTTNYYTSGANTYDPFLTNIISMDCNGCYSLKLLNSSYSDYILFVRRSVDDAYSYFYSDLNGNLTTQKNNSGTTIESFLYGRTGYIVTWYDQSGKGNHATQLTTSLQPLYDVTNKCIDFGYTSEFYYLNIPSDTIPRGLNAPYSFIVKRGSFRNIIGAGILGAAGEITSGISTSNGLVINSINTYKNYWWSNDFTWSNSRSNNQTDIIGVTYDGTTRKSYSYGTYVNQLASTGYNVSDKVSYIGWNGVTNEYLQGQLYSILICNRDLTQTVINLTNDI